MEDIKRIALDIARGLPHKNFEDLLANAKAIEDHLASTSLVESLAKAKEIEEYKANPSARKEDIERFDETKSTAQENEIYDNKLAEAQAEAQLRADLREKETISETQRKKVDERVAEKVGSSTLAQTFAEVRETFNEMQKKDAERQKIERERRDIWERYHEARKPQKPLAERVEEPAPAHVTRKKRTARKVVINGTLAKEGDALMLVDEANGCHFKMLNTKGKLFINELHPNDPKKFSLDFRVQSHRPYKIEYDGARGTLTYWSNNDGSAIRTLSVSTELDLTPVFLGTPTDKWETKSEETVVEEVVNYEVLEDLIEQKSREEMGKWLNLVSDLPRETWMLDRPVKVRNAEGSFTNLKWSGFADDLREVLNAGNTVLATARQIGTTTFLASVAAQQSYKKKVCFITTNVVNCTNVADLLRSFQHDPENVQVHTFESFLRLKDIGYVADGGKKLNMPYDLIILDNAAFLPYKDSDEMLNQLRLCKHVIVASCPAQATGLFHALHAAANNPKDFASFVGVDIPWTMPLMWRDPTALMAQMKVIMENMGDRFKNQFLCAFRPVNP